MESVKLDLTARQISKLRNGHPVQLKPSQVGCGMEVKLHASKAKKLHSAARRSKGCRVSMTQEECDMSGGKLSWKGFKRGLKKGWDVYQKDIKPIVSPLIRKGLKAAVEKGLPALAAAVGQPELAAAVPALSKGVDAVGNATKAFGVKSDLKKISNFYKKNVKKHTSPLIKKGLEKGVRKGLPALAKLTKSKALEEAAMDVAETAVKHGIPAFMKQTGLGVRRTSHGKQRYLASMADSATPAANPLIDIGSPYYGQDFIRGMGYGILVASR